MGGPSRSCRKKVQIPIGSDRVSSLTQRQAFTTMTAFAIAQPSCTQLFFFLFSSFFSISLFVSPTPALPVQPSAHLISSRNSTIFLHFLTLSTLIFHYFPFFLPYSPNFTSPNPNLYVSPFKNLGTSRCFSDLSIAGFRLSRLQASFCTHICYHPALISLSLKLHF